jgi:hypothetical protein
VVSPRESHPDTLAGLTSALDELVALAQRSIKVFDIDLSWGDWNTRARCDALAAFMRGSRNGRVEIIVHDTRWLESSGSRLTTLLQRYSHAMTIYRSGAGARHAMDPLAIVDDTHFLHRLHIDRLNATLSIGDADRASPLVERFQEIWATGEPGLSGTTLGL